MEQYELLVHVSAAARVQDDGRYLCLAQSIVDFEPAAATAVVSGSGSFTNSYGTGTGDHVKKHHSENHVHDSSQSRAVEGDQTSRSKAAASLADWPRKKPASRPHSKTGHTSAYNPPYKNPFHGAEARVSPIDPRTPHQVPRPCTAPDQFERTIQVPFTGIGKRRTNSESASFASVSSAVPDSQKTQLIPPSSSQPKAKSTIEESFVQESMAASKSLIRSFSQTSLDDEPIAKRTRPSNEDEAGMLEQSRPNGIEAYFLRERSLDWTSSPACSEESRTDSVPSTVSPSQPFPDIAKSVEVGSASASQPRATMPIDLTVTSSSRGETSPKVSGSKGVDEGSSPQNSKDQSSSTWSQKHSSWLFGRDARLEAKSEDPPTGHMKFTSHITGPLRDLANRLAFERFFRPVEVKRDVRVLERGFWLMDVTMADAEVVESARRSPSKEEKLQAFRERFAGESHDARMKLYGSARQRGTLHDFDYGFENGAVGLLTKEEILLFWRNVSSYIEESKAGWGIRMVMEEVESGSSDTGRARIRVRVFSWGEIIGHLYLVFWVLSDKATSRIPMEWVAADGTVVVRMAGTRAGRGKLGTWTRKGPEGERGFWGVAQE